MKNRGFLKPWSAMLLVSIAMASHAAAPPVTPYNPRPAEGDLVLPMPNGAEMVFREIRVPGKNFWGDTERIVELGYVDGGIFEGPQRVQVSGSFPTQDGNDWAYYLGKYEVTKGQFAAVMGLDKLIEVSGNPQDKKLKDLSGSRLQEALAKPLSWVSWRWMEQFIHDYNRWLFDEAHPEHVAALPHLDGVPGFIRLPTELEWEYAARGGDPAHKNGSFTHKLPFPEGQINEYAWHLGNAKNEAKRIGLRKPNRLGLYDMFGNVQELTDGPFLPEIWQGKPGGLTARGGSVATAPGDFRASHREEVEIYRWNPDKKVVQEARSFTTGIRLAIGSNVVVTPEHRALLEQEYKGYLAKIRDSMPVGRTQQDALRQAASSLVSARDILDDLISKNPPLRENLLKIKQELQKSEEQFVLGLREASRSTSEDALRYGAHIARDVYRLNELAKAVEIARQLAQSSTAFQQRQRDAEQLLDRRQQVLAQDVHNYGQKVAKLAGYDPSYIDQAFTALDNLDLSKRERAVLSVLKGHLKEYQVSHRVDEEGWRRRFDEMFKDFPD